MTPQAKRYKHFHGFPDKEQDAPRPTTTHHASFESRDTVTLGPDDINLAGQTLPMPDKPLFSQRTNGPGSDLTESDSIVIFVSFERLQRQGNVFSPPPLQLPVLGFEKHRQRKYLTRVIDELEAAASVKARGKHNVDAEAGSKYSERNWPSGQGSYHDFFRRDGPPAPPPLPGKKMRAAPQSNEKLLLAGYLDPKEGKPVHCRRTLDQFSYSMLKSTERRDKSQVAYRWAKTFEPHYDAKDRPIIMVDQLWLWVLHDGKCTMKKKKKERKKSNG